jgi:SAM-dependent methyltransferase
MSQWSEKIFKTRADLMLLLLNARWSSAPKYVDSMIDILKSYGKESGNVLDICCGNGRISTHFALKGYSVTGIDYSPAFIDDAEKKANEYGVSDKTDFILGDVRRINELVGEETFDVFVNAWTSIGYTTWEDDVSIFKQARDHAADDAVLFIVDTMHMARALGAPKHRGFVDYGDTLMLESSSYDPVNSRMSNTWRFYKKDGDDLLFDDQCEYDIRIYSLNELSQILSEAGWSMEAYYGDISSKTSMSPNTGMSIVAKA